MKPNYFLASLTLDGEAHRLSLNTATISLDTLIKLSQFNQFIIHYYTHNK